MRRLGLMLVALALPAAAEEAAKRAPYTAAQAERGKLVFAEKCALCHGATLGGGAFGPTVRGVRFREKWGPQGAGALYDYLSKNMPPAQAESVSPEDHADAMALILQANGATPGDAELPADAAALKAYELPK